MCWCGVREDSAWAVDSATFLRMELKRLSEKPLLALVGDEVRRGRAGMPESV